MKWVQLTNTIILKLQARLKKEDRTIEVKRNLKDIQAFTCII